MNQFTPAPWDFDAMNFDVYQLDTIDVLAEIPTGKPHHERKANAALMAAAPDLYGALKDLLFNAVHGNGLEGHYKVQERARFALAKAEGTA